MVHLHLATGKFTTSDNQLIQYMDEGRVKQGDKVTLKLTQKGSEYLVNSISFGIAQREIFMGMSLKVFVYL